MFDSHADDRAASPREGRMPVCPEAVTAWIDALGSADTERSDGERIDLIAGLERLKGAAAAAQARLTDGFARSQREAAACDPVAAADEWIARERKAKADRSIWAQVALARRESPHRGQVHVGLARALHEMPYTLGALAAGDISEWQATLVARETAVLTSGDRAHVDRELAGRLAGLGDRATADEARRIGDRLDPEAALRRLQRARADRRVSVRSAPGSMARLTGVLPLPQGVAAYAVLRQHALSRRNAGDPRSLGQIMADELYARLTGRRAANGTGAGSCGETRSTAGEGEPASLDVEIGLVMSERTLLRGGSDPALLTGPDGAAYGHVPAALARALVRTADRSWLRRLYAAPQTGELVSMDSRSRTFTGRLRQLLVWRDQTCRTP